MKKPSFTQVLLIFPLLLAVSLPVSAQKKTPQKDVLTTFEKNIEQGKIAETERPLLDFALADPQNLRALELVGRLRFRQNRIEEAKALYARVLTLDANFTTAKINYGIILAQNGQLADARQILSGITDSELKDTATRLNFAQVLTLIGDIPKALETAEKLPLNIKNYDALPVFAVCYLELGDQTKLDALIPWAKKIALTKADISLKFAEILLNAKRNSQAVELLRAVALAAPKNAKALILLGKAEIYTGDFSNAKKHLAQAEVLQPKAAEVFFLQAMLANANGNQAAAFDLLEKAVSLEPNSKTLLSQFIIAAMRGNKAQKAVDAAEKLLAINPDDPDYLYLFGAASLQNGSLDKARESLETLMQIRPNDSHGCLALGLTLAAQRDQIESARRQLERCVEINPSNFEAKYQLGLSYKTQGDTAKAVQYLEETVALAPNYPLALRDLGAVYLQSGAEQKAKNVLEKAVSLAPNDAETHFQLSRLYNLLGDGASAKKHLEMFQKLRNSGGNLM